jgi:hypothetical protein
MTHDFGGDSGAGQIDEILRRELRPVKRRGRADIKNRAGISAEAFSASAFDGQ